MRYFFLAVLAFGSAALRAEPPQADAKKPAALTARELDEMWNDMTRDDDAGTKKAFQVICRLIQSPDQAVPFLESKLKPPAPADAQKIASWIADLDSDNFGVREKAN